jgi:hypothetical protein
MAAGGAPGQMWGFGRLGELPPQPCNDRPAERIASHATPSRTTKSDGSFLYRGWVQTDCEGSSNFVNMKGRRRVGDRAFEDLGYFNQGDLPAPSEVTSRVADFSCTDIRARLKPDRAPHTGRIQNDESASVLVLQHAIKK